MCTLVLFKDLSRDFPLVIAANRDEVATRPTKGPHFQTPDMFAPRDVVRGGTWIGLNRSGIVAALTNRSVFPHRNGCESRGMLVTDALGCSDMNNAITSAMKSDHKSFNGFHLLLADGRDAQLIWTDGNAFFQMKTLESGVHVLTGDGCSPNHILRDRLVRDMVADGRRPENHAWLDHLLSFHGPRPEDGTCVHGEGVRMETVFSMTIHLPIERDRWIVRWRNGRPCEGGQWKDALIEIDRDKEDLR